MRSEGPEIALYLSGELSAELAREFSDRYAQFCNRFSRWAMLR